MSQCLFSSVPAVSFICEHTDGFEHVVTHYEHQLNAVHGFNLLLVYLEHKIKRITALSLK